MSGDVLSWAVLSLGRFCQGTFCLCTQCPAFGTFLYKTKQYLARGMGVGGTGFKKQTLVGIKKSYKRLELAGMPGELGLTGTKL